MTDDDWPPPLILATATEQPPPAKPPPIPTDDLALEALSPERLRILDAVFHEAGLLASDDISPPVPTDLAETLSIEAFLTPLVTGD